MAGDMRDGDALSAIMSADDARVFRGVRSREPELAIVIDDEVRTIRRRTAEDFLFELNRGRLEASGLHETDENVSIRSDAILIVPPDDRWHRDMRVVMLLLPCNIHNGT